jgi:cytoskeletal protein CcmA (bactofilin family)
MFKKNFETESESPSGQTTILAAGTEIKGDMESKGDIRIDGTLHGNLSTASKVVVGASGMIKGNITAEKAEIMGKVIGNLRISDLLILKANSDISGNVHTRQLQVAPTASFNGECHMGAQAGANVLPISNELANAASSD